MASRYLDTTALATGLAAVALIAGSATAQDATYPEQEVAKTLDAIAASGDLQILYSADEVAGVRAAAVSDTETALGAIRQAVAGTDLEVESVNERTVVVRRSASAQDTGDSDPESDRAATNLNGDDTRERITVTAQKREQDIQDVALSIQAFSGEDLKEQGVTSTQDLQLRTPGFTMGSNVVFGQPFIRGIGNATLTIGSDSSVAVHMDGVYLTRPMSAFQEFYDVERVEVLKGPQGTLYGRNATGGVINIISQAPTEEFEAVGELTLGNYNLNRLDATVSGPIGEGLAGRLTAFTAERDGYTDNVFDGSDLDDQDIWGLRGQLLVDPSDLFTLRLIADISEENSTRGQGFKWIQAGGGSAGSTNPADEFTVAKDYPHRTDTNGHGLTAIAEWSLGGADVKSITAKRHSEFNLSLDLDASDNAVGFVDPEIEESDVFTQEFQLSGASGGFDWLLGAFYLQEDASTLFDINLPAAMVRTVPNGFTEVTAYAVFGEATFDVTEQLSLTAGGRWGFEEKEARVRNVAIDPNAYNSASNDWDSFTPRVTLEYRPNENVMLFAGYAKGYKSGGFNATSSAVPGFDPEEIDSYEAGIRSTLADGRVTANLTGFHYDYTDLQVRALVSGIISGVSNAAAADINGIEAEFAAQPTDDVSLFVNAAWLDAEFEEFITTNPDAADPNAPVDLAGNKLPRAPEIMVSAGAQKDWMLDNGGMFSVRGDLSYQSKMYFDEFNIDPRSQDDFTTLSARAGYTAPSDAWSVYLWGRNLTDEVYKINVLRSAGFYGTGAWYGPPMTYGVTLTARR